MLSAIGVDIWHRNFPSIYFRKFIVFFVPLLTATALSLSYTWSTFNTLSELNTLIWALGAVILFSVSFDREDLLRGLVVGTALAALCAVLQLLVLFPSLLEVYKDGGYAAVLEGQHVPFASFLNQNMLGGYCASIFPLSLYFALVKKEKPFFVAAIVILVGLLLSLSRLAVLSSVPSCAVIAVLVFKERGIKGITSFAACIGVGIALVFLIIYSPYRTTNMAIKSALEGKLQRSYHEASTLNLRTDIWKTGLKALKQSPLLGYGAGAFVYPYQKYYEGKQYTKVAHGTPVKMAVELGVIGFLCFLWYCFGVVIRLREFSDHRTTSFVGLSALVVFLFGLFDFSFDTPAHVVTFFCLSSACFVSAPSRVVWPKGRVLAVALVVSLLASFVYTAKADSSRRFVEDAKTLRDGGLTADMCLLLAEAVDTMPLNNEASIFLISSLASAYVEERDLARKEGLKERLLFYTKGSEERSDKDAELFYVIGVAKRSVGNDISSCEYMDKALYYHPASACYALSAATCYAGYGQLDRALSIIRSMEVYFGNYQRWRYPDGLLVHKMKDLEAEIEYAKGNPERALMLARENLNGALQDRFVITDWRARQSLSKGDLIGHLTQRVRSVETKIAHNERESADIAIH